MSRQLLSKYWGPVKKFDKLVLNFWLKEKQGTTNEFFERTLVAMRAEVVREMVNAGMQSVDVPASVPAGQSHET